MAPRPVWAKQRRAQSARRGALRPTCLDQHRVVSDDAHFFDSLACCRQVFPRFSRCLGSQRMVLRHASYRCWSGWACGPRIRGFVSCFACFSHAQELLKALLGKAFRGRALPVSFFRRYALKKRDGRWSSTVGAPNTLCVGPAPLP